MTSPSSSTSGEAAVLEELPSEMVVRVASTLDLCSTLALASTSTSLSTILTTTTEWIRICNKMSDSGPDREVAELTSFLRATKESDQLFQLLLHFLCTKFSSTDTDTITISCSLHQHEVSPQGMHLLHLATFAMPAEPWTITEVDVQGLSLTHLTSLASWVRRQEQGLASLRLGRLEVRTTKEWMDACMDLFERCKAWKVQKLVVSVKADVKEFWMRIRQVFQAVGYPRDYEMRFDAEEEFRHEEK